MNPNEPSKENTTGILRIFVYGTLKRGYWNHDRFCRGAISIEQATVWGRLYHLPAGFPALEIPESSILAHGTADPLTDALTQQRITAETITTIDMSRPSGDWDRIHGEIITFAAPDRVLPPIDRLEGFRPDGRSMYRRVLVPAWNQAVVCLAWVYSMDVGSHGQRLADGVWNR
ncbi:MAG TPA: gamma-glutamylcyclotransferase [Methylothermaceae bacterium]|nr:gamma-glutamylcyclotransferase [Methylothermaceae bacterium]